MPAGRHPRAQISQIATHTALLYNIVIRIAELGPQFNTALQRPVTEAVIDTSHLGNVIMATNEDLVFDPEAVLSTLFSSDGVLRKALRLGNKVHSIPGHDLAFREQRIAGNEEALLAVVRQDATEINLLRMLGLSITRHVSFVIPSRPETAGEVPEQKPVIITVAERLPERDAEHTFNPGSKDNALMAARILQVFQAYYTHEPSRAHKTDITVAGQYSWHGVLMDLDMHTTQSPGAEPEPWHEQLDRMYKNFGLHNPQIEDLTRDYSYFPKDTPLNPV